MHIEKCKQIKVLNCKQKRLNSFLFIYFIYKKQPVNFTKKINQKTLDFYTILSYNDIRMTAEKRKVADTPG